MIVQIALSIGLIGIAAYAFTQRGCSRTVAMAMMATCAVGEVFVLAPDFATRVAHAVGVGRGADLIMYGFIVATLGLIFNLHLRLHAMTQTITDLTRHVALLTAQPPSATSRPGPTP